MNALARHIAQLGVSPAEAARRTGIKYNTLWRHCNGSRPISGGDALRYELGIHIHRSNLRPDLWPPDETISYGSVDIADVERMLGDPDAFIKLTEALKAERAKCAVLENLVESTGHGILVGEMAKLVSAFTTTTMNNESLFEWLRTEGYLFPCGDTMNMPTPFATNNGWMMVKEKSRILNDGSLYIVRTTKITGKGQVYFLNLFTEKERHHE